MEFTWKAERVGQERIGSRQDGRRRGSQLRTGDRKRREEDGFHLRTVNQSAYARVPVTFGKCFPGGRASGNAASRSSSEGRRADSCRVARAVGSGRVHQVCRLDARRRRLPRKRCHAPSLVPTPDSPPQQTPASSPGRSAPVQSRPPYRRPASARMPWRSRRHATGVCAANHRRGGHLASTCALHLLLRLAPPPPPGPCVRAYAPRLLPRAPCLLRHRPCPTIPRPSHGLPPSSSPRPPCALLPHSVPLWLSHSQSLPCDNPPSNPRFSTRHAPQAHNSDCSLSRYATL